MCKLFRPSSSHLSIAFSLLLIIKVSFGKEADSRIVTFGATEYLILDDVWTNWHSAWNLCDREQMMLVSIETVALTQFLMQKIKNLCTEVPCQRRYWTAGKQNTDGTYYWMNNPTEVGEAINGYTNWKPNGLSIGARQCIYMNSFGKWGAYPCIRSSRVICERSSTWRKRIPEAFFTDDYSSIEDLL